MLKTIDSASDWRQALAQLPSPHVLQSWEWGEIKGQTGWTPKRYLLQDNQHDIFGAFQLLLRRAPARLPFTIGYVPKGPILDWENQRTVNAALNSIEQAARKERCLFVKIDPNVDETSDSGRELLENLRGRGWSFSQEQIQFKNTAISWLGSNFEGATDHGQQKDDLLAQMKSKWRYNIRLAERRGVSIRTGNEADFATFYQLYAATSQRDGFAIRPFDYYETVWKTYWAAQQEPNNPAGGVLLLAEHADEEQPLAGVYLMRYGKTAWYFYGASSERRRRDMPNYLLQWRAIQWALSQGAEQYDWWGAPTDFEDPNDRMAGVWRFKQGFGAALQPHIGAWDWSPSPLIYRAYWALKPLVQRFGQS